MKRIELSGTEYIEAAREGPLVTIQVFNKVRGTWHVAQRLRILAEHFERIVTGLFAESGGE